MPAVAFDRVRFTKSLNQGVDALERQAEHVLELERLRGSRHEILAGRHQLVDQAPVRMAH